MKKSFISLNGAVTLSVISLLVYLGRSFIDFYFVYEELGLSVSVLGLVTLVNLVLFGGWIGGLLATVRGSHRGLIIVFGFNLFFLQLDTLMQALDLVRCLGGPLPLEPPQQRRWIPRPHPLPCGIGCA